MRDKRKTLDKKIDNLKFKKIAKKQKMQERGITLIALVVTIIILLILAGVTLNIALSDNGLFNKTKKAVEEYKTATVEEQRQIAMTEAAMNFNGTEYKYSYNGKEVIVPIPAGFAVSGIEGENTVEDGLVIIDSKGNEFVWIEVPKNEQIYERTTTNETDFDDDFYTNIELDLKKYVEDYRDNDGLEGKVVSDGWIEGCQLDENKCNELKKSMLKSIYINAGFWIGRYEVGYEGEVRYEPDNGWTATINVTPVVKRGVYPLNYICYPQAQNISNNITYGEYVGSLLFGIQYDLTCKFIEEKHGKSKYEITENCISWGNYRNAVFDIDEGKYSVNDGMTFEKVLETYNKGSYESGTGILLTTGASKRNSVLNIYDFAGNLNEFSLEFEKDNMGTHSLLRGGSYRMDGNAWTTVKGGSVNYGSSYGDDGFRVTLIPLDN